MQWRSYASVRELPGGLWEQKVARGRCTTSTDFLAALEHTYPEQRHQYFVAYEGAEVVGCAMLNVSRHDLSLELPKVLRRVVAFVRRLWPGFGTLGLAMTGTLETYGDHYWYDERRTKLDTFVDELLQQLRAHERDYRVLVLRDYIVTPSRVEGLDAVRGVFERHACTMGDALPVSQLDIKDYSTPEEYLGALKGRDRYTIRKATKRAREQGLRLEFVEDYEPLLDECYPLYLAVNERATELVTAPLPRRFFSAVKQELGEGSRLLTARDREGRLLAFALVLETDATMEIFAVGMDYDEVGTGVSMYNLLWECIADAIRGGRAQVDLGVTNTFIKQRFGASVYPMKVFFKASNWLLEGLLRSAFDLDA